MSRVSRSRCLCVYIKRLFFEVFIYRTLQTQSGGESGEGGERLVMFTQTLVRIQASTVVWSDVFTFAVMSHNPDNNAFKLAIEDREKCLVNATMLYINYK